MRTIILDTFDFLNSTQKYRVVPPLTILTLGDSRIHVCSSNGSNVVTYIEASVNEYFGIVATVYILYINPNDYYIRFQKDFDAKMMLLKM